MFFDNLACPFHNKVNKVEVKTRNVYVKFAFSFLGFLKQRKQGSSIQAFQTEESINRAECSDIK